MSVMSQGEQVQSSALAEPSVEEYEPEVFTVVISTACKSIAAAANTIEGFIGRAGVFTQAARVSHSEAIAELQGALRRVTADWKASARRLQRHRSALFDKCLDETSAVHKMLQGGARVCLYEGCEAEVVLSSVSALMPLVESDALPRYSSAVDTTPHDMRDAVDLLSRCSSLRSDLNGIIATAKGPDADNRIGIHMSCDGGYGRLLRSLLPPDFGIEVTSTPQVPERPLAVSDVRLIPSQGNGIQLQFQHEGLPSTAVGITHINVRITLLETSLLHVALQARAGIEGVHVRTLAIRNDTGNRGLAISPDGTRLAVSNYHSHEIAVYSLPDGALLSEFGGQGAAPGRFNYPQKMCFSPADGGNLFIADAANNRLQARFDFARSYVVFTSACSLQEMTSAGAHVRVIGEGLTYDSECGITASADIIAVTTDGSKRVCLFDMTSGDVIRTFGDAVSAEGRLSRFAGIRFTPDGRHILIAEYVYKRLCLFTLDGAFVCYIGEGTLSSSPMDVDFAANGDILVAGGHRICVLSPDGSSLLRTFGSFGDSPGLFKGTYALAMHGGQLYVLDSNSARVQVFT